jgi:hypothetical protein
LALWALETRTVDSELVAPATPFRVLTIRLFFKLGDEQQVNRSQTSVRLIYEHCPALRIAHDELATDDGNRPPIRDMDHERLKWLRIDGVAESFKRHLVASWIAIDVVFEL